MPHDKKGRLIEVGDVIIAKPYNYSRKREAGVVVRMREGQTCSGDFVFQRPFEAPIADAFGAEDAELVLKADGSEPEAPKAQAG